MTQNPFCRTYTGGGKGKGTDTRTRMRTELICLEGIKITRKKKKNLTYRERFFAQGTLRTFSIYMNAGWEPRSQVQIERILCRGTALQVWEMFASFFASVLKANRCPLIVVTSTPAGPVGSQISHGGFSPPGGSPCLTLFLCSPKTFIHSSIH